MSEAMPSKPNPLDVRASSWAALGLFDTTAIGGAMGVAIRYGILRRYVRAYLCEHGRYPTGRHKVRGTWKESRIAFEARFPGKATAALAAHGRRLSRHDLWGLDTGEKENSFRRARKEYRDSADRPKLRAWLLRQIEQAMREGAK